MGGEASAGLGWGWAGLGEQWSQCNEPGGWFLHQLLRLLSGSTLTLWTFSFPFLLSLLCSAYVVFLVFPTDFLQVWPPKSFTNVSFFFLEPGYFIAQSVVALGVFFSTLLYTCPHVMFPRLSSSQNSSVSLPCLITCHLSCTVPRLSSSRDLEQLTGMQSLAAAMSALAAQGSQGQSTAGGCKGYSRFGLTAQLQCGMSKQRQKNSCAPPCCYRPSRCHCQGFHITENHRLVPGILAILPVVNQLSVTAATCTINYRQPVAERRD